MGPVAGYPAPFREAMKRLVGLKFAPADLATHWDALKDLSVEDLDRAVARAQRECDEYPSPRTLRSFAALTAERIIGPDEDRSVPLAETTIIRFPQGGRDIPVTHDWRFYCTVCEDGGWASFHCNANGMCGREKCHYAHEYVKHCACWDSNPALLKRRERMAQQAHTRGTNREH